MERVGGAVANEEKRLAELAAKRDRKAFGRLYDLYVEKIYKYVYYKSGRTDEAEDLTALVFLKAWEAIPHYRWEGYPFSTWLYRIAHNQVIDYYRTHRETFPFDSARARVSSNDPVEEAERSFASDKVRTALQHLTYDQRRVIILRFLEGYSTTEVAAIMDKDPDAIRALQHRALRALRPWMGDERELRPMTRPQMVTSA
jgi:RNA polymerase sigma-70 factor (ECF subfamily)